MEETELTEHGIMCILDYYVQNMPDFPISFFLRCRRSWSGVMGRQQGGRRSEGTHHDLLFGAFPKHVLFGSIAACLLEIKNGNHHARLQIGRIENLDEVDTAIESVWIGDMEE